MALVGSSRDVGRGDVGELREAVREAAEIGTLRESGVISSRKRRERRAKANKK
jgi:hypothetical protein